jgi:N utilization substance protein A
VLANGKRCPNTALPGSKYCGVPAHQELALHEPDDEANPIVAEDEPELERLSDTAAPEAVTEDAAEFGNAEPEEFPAGPGDAPVAGEDQTLETGAANPVRVEDDPHGGIPVVEAGATEREAE